MAGETLDDDRARHSTFAHLIGRFTVDVHVIPVESRLLIVRNVHDVMQFLARLCKHSEHVVTVAARRNGQSVKVEIGVAAIPVLGGRSSVRSISNVWPGSMSIVGATPVHVLVLESGQAGRRIDVGDQREFCNAMDRTHDRRFGELVDVRIG